MTKNLYFVKWTCEEGHTSDHGILTDPEAARRRAAGVHLPRFSCVVVASFKLEGAEFIPTVEGDPGHLEFSLERD